MLGRDIPVQRRSGEVGQLTAAGWEGAINLPKLSEEFYRSARWLRVFTGSRVTLDRAAVLGLVTRSAGEVRRRLSDGSPLLD